MLKEHRIIRSLKPIRVFKKSNYNPVLVNALVKSYRWNRQLEDGQITISDLAEQEGSPTRLIPMHFQDMNTP